MDEADRFASWRSAEPYYGSNAKSKLCYGHDDVYRGAGRSEKDFVRTQGYLRITRCMDGLNLGLGPRSDRWSHSLDLGKRFSLSPIDVSVSWSTPKLRTPSSCAAAQRYTTGFDQFIQR
jgi:hypothetical protein